MQSENIHLLLLLMYNHAAADYICPICLGIQGVEDEHTLLKQSDRVYGDDLVTVFINSFFIGNNPGHVIVVPNEHFENIYDLPLEYGVRIFEVSQKMALALKNAYQCEGVTTLQNNEPAGNQHAFHYHLHLFPRYKDDRLHEHMGNKRLATPEERLEYSEKVRQAIEISF